MKTSLLPILSLLFAGLSACSSSQPVATTGDDMYFAPRARVARVTQTTSTTTTDYVTQQPVASTAPAQAAQPVPPPAQQPDYYQPNYSQQQGQQGDYSQNQNGTTQGVPNGQTGGNNVTNNYYGSSANAGYASPIGFYRPWYRPGISIGFGYNSFSGYSPYVGYGMSNPYAYDPFWCTAPPIYSHYYDPFWGRPMVGWSVYSPFGNPYYNSFYNPYWYGYGYGYGYGGGYGNGYYGNGYGGNQYYNDPYNGVYPNSNAAGGRQGRAVVNGSNMQRPSGTTYNTPPNGGRRAVVMPGSRPAQGNSATPTNGYANGNGTTTGGTWAGRPRSTGAAPGTTTPGGMPAPAPAPATSQGAGTNYATRPANPAGSNYASRPAATSSPNQQQVQAIQPAMVDDRVYSQPQRPAASQGAYASRPSQSQQPTPAPNYYQPARRAESYNQNSSSGSDNTTSRPRSNSNDGGSRQSYSQPSSSYGNSSGGSSSGGGSYSSGGGISRPR